jgi:hypothetical protein
MKLSEYDMEIEYKPGKDLVNAEVDPQLRKFWVLRKSGTLLNLSQLNRRILIGETSINCL